LAIESKQSLKGGDVVMTLNRIKIQRGVPTMLYCDNGSEFETQDYFRKRTGNRAPRVRFLFFALEDKHNEVKKISRSRYVPVGRNFCVFRFLSVSIFQ
jgi:hypothetical protein